MKEYLPEFELNPARRFIASPNWDGLGVLFDIRSGDYWVVSSEVLAVFRVPENDVTATALQELPHATKQNLLAHGIIQPSRASCSNQYPCR